MDKNQITGIVLISVIFLVYFMFFKPDNNDNSETTSSTKTEQVDSTSSVNSDDKAISDSDSTVLADSNAVAMDSSIVENDSTLSLQKLIKAEKYGVFADAIDETNEEEIISITTNNLDLQFTSKGGRLQRARLVQFKRYDEKELVLVDKNNYSSDITFKTKKGNEVSINTLTFTGEKVLETKDSAQINFTANIAPGKQIVRSFSIDRNYLVKESIRFKGLDSDISSDALTWTVSDDMYRLEKGLKQSRGQKSYINYANKEEGYDNFSFNGAQRETETVKNVDWISFKQSYFSYGFVFDFPIPEVKLSGNTGPNDQIVKQFGFSASIPSKQVTENTLNVSHYLGPNDYDIMGTVAEDFEKNVDFGWPVLRHVNRYAIYPLFKFLESFIPSYGIIILILVIIIKSSLLPLTYRSQVGMAKMRVLKPEVDKINEQYSDNKQEAQAKTMEFYRQFGVNPMSGCIPMLLQMPVLFAMFRLFPNLLELRQKSFLWASDLSTYDSILSWSGGDWFPLNTLDGHLSLFTLLMTASTIAYTVFNNQMTSATQPGMKTMSYLMPVIFFFVLNSYSSGLTYYYLLSNLYSIGQTIVIRRFVNEDKIREKLEANRIKKSNSKKSSFQNSLNHALKKQQDKANNRTKKK